VVSQLLSKIVQRVDLSESESKQIMSSIADGEISAAQLGAFLIAFKMKGETPQEIVGFTKAIREKQSRIFPDVGFYIDTNGTGGDAANTFNVSTAAAFVIAASGVPVAKYGGRGFSSRSGSADVLEALGCPIEQTPDKVRRCIEQIGIGFMYSPCFSDIMRKCEPVRKELGLRTIFNVLGPLTNPADPRGRLLGVYSAELATLMALCLRELRCERALLVHGADGLDEITITGTTEVTELREGRIETYAIAPTDFGIPIQSLQSVRASDPTDSAEIMTAVLSGESGAARDIVLLNSGAGLYVGKKVSSLKEGVDLAKRAIDSGEALRKLNDLISFYRN
jgi:anthranilate phosphoribosyltransferase